MNRLGKYLGTTLLLSLLWLSSYGQYLNWNYSPIRTTVQASGATPDFQVDAIGNLHCVYWNPHTNKLYYGFRPAAGGAWIFQQPDPAAASGYRAALAIDGAGKAHIAYYASNEASPLPKAYLRYATNINGSWQVESVLKDTLLGNYGYDEDYRSLCQQSIDIHIQPATGEVVVSCFDASVSNFLACSLSKGTEKVYNMPASAYQLDLKIARRSSAGTWTMFSGLNVPFTEPDIDKCMARGDRFGEFHRLLPSGDSLLLITNSRYNHALYLFSTNGSDWNTWKYRTLDSAYRVLPTFSIFNNPSAISPMPSYATETFESVDAQPVGDSLLHLSYAYTLAYGSISEGQNRRALCYMNLRLDSLAVPTYRPRIHNIDGLNNTTRRFTSINAIDADTIFYSSVNNVTGVLSQKRSLNAGRIWFDVPVATVATTTAPQMRTFQDSTYILYYDQPLDALVLFSQQKYSLKWRKKILTRSEDFGVAVSAAVSRNGSTDDISATYIDRINGELWYARKSGASAWSFQQVDTASQVLRSASLAMTGAQPNIAYTDNNSHSLKVATLMLGNWQINTVDTAGIPLKTALVTQGTNLHIAYYDSKAQRLRYATNSSGNWQRTTIDSTGVGAGRDFSLAADAAGGLHLAYFAEDSVRYGFKPLNGAWTLQTIADTFAHLTIALAVTSDNQPRIAFVASDENAVYYLSPNGTNSWLRELASAPTNSIIGTPIYLRLDAKNRPWLFSNDNDVQSNIRLMRRDTLGKWYQVAVTNNTPLIANAFDVQRVEKDFYIVGTNTNVLMDGGLGMLFAQNATSTLIDGIAVADAQVQLFPNPANDYCTLGLSVAAGAPVAIRLFDLTGSQLGAEYTFAAGETAYQFPVMALPNGVYFCQIQVGKTMLMRKIVIAR